MSDQPNIPATLMELVDEYCASNITVKSKHTKSLYRLTIKRFEEFLGRPGTLADFTDKQIVEFVRARVECINKYDQTQVKGLRRSISPYTLEREGNKLLSLWRWAAAQGWVKPPTIKIAKRSPKTPIAWSRDEIDKIISACRVYPMKIRQTPANVYFMALICCCMTQANALGRSRNCCGRMLTYLSSS
jgi:integrase